MMSESKTRVWLASLVFGCSASLILIGAMARMGIANWCPLFWPGLFLETGSALLRGRAWSERTSLVLLVSGNTIFYSWIFSKIVRAEITARGHLSRYFLR
jgi:hypothetical protein